MNRDQCFDLKLSTGKVVRWSGRTGKDAARRYVDIFPGVTVIAFRHPPHGFFVGMKTIVP